MSQPIATIYTVTEENSHPYSTIDLAPEGKSHIISITHVAITNSKN